MLDRVDVITLREHTRPVDRRDRFFQAAPERLQNELAVREIAEGDVRVPEYKAGHKVRDLPFLAAIGPQKFGAHGRIIKERLRLDRGAAAQRAGRALAQRAAVTADLVRFRRAFGAGTQRDARHGRDARQRFAAKAERMDMIEVFRPLDLARRVRQKGRAQLSALDPVAVVRHADAVLAAPLDLDRDIFCACVQAVFDKLLDDRIRPVDHFARRDAVKDGAV